MVEGAKRFHEFIGAAYDFAAFGELVNDAGRRLRTLIRSADVRHIVSRLQLFEHLDPETGSSSLSLEVRIEKMAALAAVAEALVE
jgi:hypothetical protein